MVGEVALDEGRRRLHVVVEHDQDLAPGQLDAGVAGRGAAARGPGGDLQLVGGVEAPCSISSLPSVEPSIETITS